jgi:hypothetical protein
MGIRGESAVSNRCAGRDAKDRIRSQVGSGTVGIREIGKQIKGAKHKH